MMDDEIVISLLSSTSSLIEELSDLLRQYNPSVPDNNPFLPADIITLNGATQYVNTIAYRKRAPEIIEVHYVTNSGAHLSDYTQGEFVLYDYDKKTICSFNGQTKIVYPEQNGTVMGELIGKID